MKYLLSLLLIATLFFIFGFHATANALLWLCLILFIVFPLVIGLAAIFIAIYYVIKDEIKNGEKN